MSSTDLINLTERQGTSLDGVLPSNFTSPWSPELPSINSIDITISVTMTTANVFTVQNVLRDLFAMNSVITSTEAESPQSRLTRYMCHRVIDRIPEQGLQELSESLSNMWRFYSQHPNVGTPALPLPARKLSAKRGKTYQRPDFSLTSE